MFRRLVLTVSLTLLCISAMAQQGYAVSEGIVYTALDDAYAQERCRLDVYYPEGVKNAPVVVWFHGGGLTGGKRYIPKELKNSGIVVVAAGYRLMPGAGIADCIDDAASAVAWTVDHAEEYGGSRDRIYVSGHSAGGYLTSMVELDRRWLGKYGIDPDSLAGYMPFSGQAITHFALRSQQGIGPLTATVDEFAPLYHVRSGLPLTVIISGDRELEMNGRYEEQAYYWRMLRLAGNQDVHIYEMQGYSHGQMPHPAFHIMKSFIGR